MRVIVQLEVPFIDNVDMSDFAKISCDERVYLDKFRDHIREHFIDILGKEGDPFFDKELQKVGIKLRNGTRSLASDIQAMGRKAAFRAAGAVVCTTMATLVAINSSLFQAWSAVLGPGGGLVAFLKIIEDYNEQRRIAKDSP